MEKGEGEGLELRQTRGFPRFSLMTTGLKLYVVTHGGGWVGGSSVAVAHSENEARALLEAEWAATGDKHMGRDPHFTELPLSKPLALILTNGDY